MRTLSKLDFKRRWVQAQSLDITAPFGLGNAATKPAVEHLGYVQIDTIHVIERCHHHILFNRIPNYEPSHLRAAQTEEKSVFEYWTHALAYLPTRDHRFFIRDMKQYQKETPVSADLRKLMKRIEREGPISIRDVKDEALVEKDHPWASRKPSKVTLQQGFWSGKLVVSERVGMLKKYELASRYFAGLGKEKPATENEIIAYKIERALRTQAIVSLDSICYLEPSLKAKVLQQVQKNLRAKKLVEVSVEGDTKNRYWLRPETLEQKMPEANPLIHILSPFDPLVIQRKRLNLIFGHDHRFEAYVPKEKRILGYFALPVLMDDEIVATLDLKTDRAKKKLLVQKWTWLKKLKSKERLSRIEGAMDGFAKFQLSGCS